MSRSHDLAANEDGAGRGVKKQKYPLDDYLTNTNTQAYTQVSLLSPVSPVSSPETVDVLENAERLVKNARKKITDVSFNSALNSLDENPSRYIGEQSLDDSLLYIHQMVNSKFQESNNPNKIHTRKASLNNLANSSKKLECGQFPAKKSNEMLNKPLEISRQNSVFSTNQMGEEISMKKEKSFFKKAHNWFRIKPSEHNNVFPTSLTNNLQSKTEGSCTVPRCMTTNTGVIEMNSWDNLNSSIQVQTGPTLDIRRGLTIQTIENVHISPDASSAPIYNNIATYCFHHEPSTSTSCADSRGNHMNKYSISSSNARKNMHIQSTDYNGMLNIMHNESIHNAGTTVNQDPMKPSHDSNQDTIQSHAILTNNSNYHSNTNNDNVNRNEIDSIGMRNEMSNDNNGIEGQNVDKSLICSENLHLQRTARESVDSVTENTHLKKTVSMNLNPMVTTIHREFSVADAEVKCEDKRRDSEGRSLMEAQIQTGMEYARSYGDQQFYHVQLNENYVQRSQVCRDECRTGSYSRKYETDVQYLEKQKSKEVLETIATIEKIRLNMKDTGIIPVECTQISEDKNHYNADVVNFEFVPPSEPERFKTALENLCKISENSRNSKMNTNSKVYQGAIDAFVRMFFDSNSESNPVHGLYSPDQSLENEATVLSQNQQSTKANIPIKKVITEMQKEEAPKALKQVKLIPEQNGIEYRHRPSKMIQSKIENIPVNNLSTVKNNISGLPAPQVCSNQLKESKKYWKPLAAENNQLPKGKVKQQEKEKDMVSNNKKEGSLKNFNLKQPCVSDVDAVIKTYHDSMAAISHGTEQLSQLISHHIMKHVQSNSDKIPSPITNYSVIAGETDSESGCAGNKLMAADSTSKLVFHNSSRSPGQVDSNYRKNSIDPASIRATYSELLQSTEVRQPDYGKSKILRLHSSSVSRDDTELSNNNNSVRTNEISVSTRNEYSSMSSRSPPKQVETLLNVNEDSSLAQFNIASDTNNCTATFEVFQQGPVDIRTLPIPAQHGAMKSVHKPGGNEFMNVHYSTADPFDLPTLDKVVSDKMNFSSQSGLESSLSAYLHLENTCGKDVKLRPHSDYDIHNDQTGDSNLYKCPVLISEQGASFYSSNNNSNDIFIPSENVIPTKEMEFQIFGQILNAVKNSSPFMKQVVNALLNGMEINSINNVLKNLEDAAVQPIVIEQLLLILKDRSRNTSSFGQNPMLTNSVSILNDWQKNYSEPTDFPKVNDNINSFKHSIGFNGSMETTNIHNNRSDECVVALQSAGDQISGSSDPARKKINSVFESHENCVYLSYNHHSSGNEALGIKLPSGQVQDEILLEKRIAEEEWKNSNDDSPISETTAANKSCLSKPKSTSPYGIHKRPTAESAIESKSQQDYQEVKGKSLETQQSQSNNAMSTGQHNTNECFINSTSSNATSKKNYSENNTDKDVSFLIPHDIDMNIEVVDSSSVQKLNSVTLKNETSDEIIKFHGKSNSRNYLQLTQGQNTKINSNSDPKQSSIVTNKNSQRLQTSNASTVYKTNSIENLQKDVKNIICHCQNPKDQNDPNIRSYLIPSESSLNGDNALMDLHIQNNYTQLGLMGSEDRAFRNHSDRTTPITGRALIKRPRPSKFSTTPKSPTRKSNNPSRPGDSKTKSSEKKVSGNQRLYHGNKERVMKDVKNTESNDAKKTVSKNACPSCIQLRGKCSCLDCTNNPTNLKKYRKILSKPRNVKAKLTKNIPSPCQSNSPKRFGYTIDNCLLRKELYPTSKELSSYATPVFLESCKKVNSKSIDGSQGIVNNDKKLISIRTLKEAAGKVSKSIVKPGKLSRNSNNNNRLMTTQIKPRRDKKLSQDAASDSDNSKLEDNSRNVTLSSDFTVCKSTEMQDSIIPDEIVCNSTRTVRKEVSILDETSPLSSTKLDKITEINIPVNKTGTVECFESCSLIQDSTTSHNNKCDVINITQERITINKGMKDFSTIGSQTLKSGNDFQKHQANSVETISEAGIGSVYKTCLNIFDNENVIILQPLNELDHTFFIAKPNCVERKLIQEKLSKRCAVQTKEITNYSYPSTSELNLHHNKTNEEVTHYNTGIVKRVACIDKGTSKENIQLNSTTSVINSMKNTSCQAGDTGIENSVNEKQSIVSFAPMHITSSDVSVSNNKKECGDLCINDKECLNICPQPLPKLDNVIFHCKQDCLKEEICLELCPAASQTKPSLQSSSININGILKKFIAENDISNVKLPIVKGLLQELKKVEDILRTRNETFGTIYEESESQNNHDKAKIQNAEKLVKEEGTDPRCNTKEVNQKSIQYEEPHDKIKKIMTNQKSLILPNVVRGIADMHPSTKLERLKLRSADPLVSGNFNKSESDKRYSVFNQSDPRYSSIDLNDPRTRAHFATIAQQAKFHEEERSSDSSTDIIQSALSKNLQTMPAAGNLNNSNSSKLYKSRRGMDADSNLSVQIKQRLVERDDSSMKSFQSSDLESGEFLQVRTPFDNSIKLCKYSGRNHLKIGRFSQDRAKSNSLYDTDKNHSCSDRNVHRTNTQKITNNQSKIFENEYELCIVSAETPYIRRKRRSNSDKFFIKSKCFTPDKIKSKVNGCQKTAGKSDPEFEVTNKKLMCDEAKHLKYIAVNNSQFQNESTLKSINYENSKAASSISNGKSSTSHVKLNTIKVMERQIATSDSKSSNFQINKSHNTKVATDAHAIININWNIDSLQKYSDQPSISTEYSNRPQIIDHFLGKTKLEDLNIKYTNNKANAISEQCRTLGSIDQQDQTSCDTYSEGEINLSSSCSYSVGEVKNRTSSSTTTSKSFRDPDGLTIFITKSVLDSTPITCISPGEILADFEKTKNDVSSCTS